MNITNRVPHSRRRLLPALLLAAFPLAVLAGSALAANLVANGSFEKDTNGDGIPNNWGTQDLDLADKRVCNQSYAGSCSFKFTDGGGTTANEAILQIINVSGSAGDTFTLSWWTKTRDLVNGGGYSIVRIYIDHTDGSFDGNESLPLSEGTTNWTKDQFSSQSTEPYDSIRVVIIYTSEGGKTWFDKVKLVGP